MRFTLGSHLRGGLIVAAAVFVFFAAASSQATPLNLKVLVVYDPNVPDSVTVANHYIAARSIPPTNLCPISPPENNLPMTWTTYVSSVKTPVQACLNNMGRNNVLYIVLAYVRAY